MKQKQALLLSINDAFRKIIIINQPILSGYNEQRLLELRWWDQGANILKGLDLLDVDGAISKIQNRIKNGFEKYVCKKIIINGEVLRKQEQNKPIVRSGVGHACGGAEDEGAAVGRVYCEVAMY